MIAKFKSLVGKVCDYALRTKLGRAATMAAVKFLVERGMLKARIELSEEISKRGPAAYKGFSDRMQMIILDILEYVEGWLPGLKEKLDEVEATVQKEGDAIEGKLAALSSEETSRALEPVFEAASARIIKKIEVLCAR